MENIIIIAVVAVILGFALYYIIKVKKRGDRCIGCPQANKCSGRCSGEDNEYQK